MGPTRFQHHVRLQQAATGRECVLTSGGCGESLLLLLTHSDANTLSQSIPNLPCGVIGCIASYAQDVIVGTCDLAGPSVAIVYGWLVQYAQDRRAPHRSRIHVSNHALWRLSRHRWTRRLSVVRDTHRRGCQCRSCAQDAYRYHARRGAARLLWGMARCGLHVCVTLSNERQRGYIGA